MDELLKNFVQRVIRGEIPLDSEFPQYYKQYDGSSALDICADRGFYNEMVALLAKEGIGDLINKRVPQPVGYTPLDVAILSYRFVKDIRIIRLLLAHPSINVNLVTPIESRTPLQMAIHYNLLDVVELLLAHPSTDVNIQTEHGQSPLITAVKNGNNTSVALLLERPDLNVNVQNDRGETALMLAVSRERVLMTTYLLAREDINPNLLDIHGDTALMKAVIYKSYGALNLLLAKPGLDMDIRDSRGRTASEIAEYVGAPPAIKEALHYHEQLQHHKKQFEPVYEELSLVPPIPREPNGSVGLIGELPRSNRTDAINRAGKSGIVFPSPGSGSGSGAAPAPAPAPAPGSVAAPTPAPVPGASVSGGAGSKLRGGTRNGRKKCKKSRKSKRR